MKDAEYLKYFKELENAIDWLYHQDAVLFLCGEIIEIHTAKEFIENETKEPVEGDFSVDPHILKNTWKHITQNIKPMIEMRKWQLDKATELATAQEAISQRIENES